MYTYIFIVFSSVNLRLFLNEYIISDLKRPANHPTC
jgi:hypothetical protein